MKTKGKSFAWREITLAILFALIGISQTFSQKSQKPNVLLIYVDDMAAVAGTYGGPAITPNMDKFAKEGIRFDNAYCNVPICTASRTSILTGVRPETSKLFGIEHDFKKVLPNNISMPKHFGNNGYHTVTMGKVADDRGGQWNNQWDDFHFGYRISSSRATNKLDELNKRNDPWFLAVGFSEPHCEWNPSKSSLGKYNVNNIQLRGPGRKLNKGYQTRCYGFPERENQGITMSNAQARDVTMRYYADITDVDKKVGDVLQKARNLKLYDNTIIVVWSGDHGFQLGENGLWGKWVNYRASTKIPLMMHVPGVTTPNTSTNRLVETVDMYQTLSDLAGLPAPKTNLEGHSFAPVLSDPNIPWKKAVYSYDISGNKRAVKTEQYDYIMDNKGKGLELYDMIADPFETKNIISSKSGVASQMKALYDGGWKKALPDGQNNGNKITNLQAPSSVSQGQTVSVSVNYEASATRDIVVMFQLDTAPWTLYEQARASVNAGKGTKSINISIPADVALANGAYQFQSFLVAPGGNWAARLDNQRKSDVSVTGGTTPNPTTDGGTVASTTNQTAIATTTGDGIADLVQFKNTSKASASYRYLITDEDGNILTTETSSHDFEGASVGICKVYGISYQGNLSVGGKNVKSGGLATGAFDVSSNSIVVTRKAQTTTPPSGGPDGYTYATDEGGTVNVSGTVNIAYGANGKFEFLKNVSSNTPCNNATFGDPIPGVKKACYIQQVSTTNPNPTPPTSGNCSFGTPTSGGLASLDRASYTNIFVLGDGPNVSNIRRFRISWDAGSKKLSQFAFNTANGNPSYYVDLRGKIEQKFGGSNPSVKISGSGIGVDGDYWVTKRGNDFVMASKGGKFTIYCSTSSSKPSCTGQKITQQETAITIYPNPAQETLNINGVTTENAVVTISNLLGKVVFTSSLTKGQNSLDVRQLTSGIYFISITQLDSSISNKTFVIK